MFFLNSREIVGLNYRFSSLKGGKSMELECMRAGGIHSTQIFLNSLSSLPHHKHLSNSFFYAHLEFTQHRQKYLKFSQTERPTSAL